MTAPLSIQQERETYVREDGTTFTRDDIFVKLSVVFRESMLAKLKGPKLSVYLCIALHCGNEDMESWPSIPTIEKETGYSHAATLKALKDLQTLQMIRVFHQFKENGACDSNIYQVGGYATMGGRSPSNPRVGQAVAEGGSAGDLKEESKEEETIEEEASQQPPAGAVLEQTPDTGEEVRLITPLEPETLPPAAEVGEVLALSLPGMHIVKNSTKGEVAEIIAEPEDTVIRCPLCETEHVWPSSKTKRRKAQSLMCHPGESKSRGGCGAYFIVRPPAHAVEQTVYAHPATKGMGEWTVTFDYPAAPPVTKRLPIDSDDTVRRLFSYWERDSEIVKSKLYWASTQPWMMHHGNKSPNTIEHVLAAVDKSRKNKEEKYIRGHSEVTPEDLVLHISEEL